MIPNTEINDRDTENIGYAPISVLEHEINIGLEEGREYYDRYGGRLYQVSEIVQVLKIYGKVWATDEGDKSIS